LRWGEVIVSLIFFLITIIIKRRIEDQHKERVLRLDYQSFVHTNSVSSSQDSSLSIKKDTTNDTTEDKDAIAYF